MNHSIVLKRFWNKVHKTDTCWEWQGYKHQQGYGQIRINKKVYSVHRWIYQYIYNKTLSSDIFVCHTCDNPSCVNPDHLFEGTHRDNMLDKIKKERQAKGVTNGNHKLTEQQVLEIMNSKSTVKELAKQYQVTIYCIYNIKSKRNWKHLTK